MIYRKTCAFKRGKNREVQLNNKVFVSIRYCNINFKGSVTVEPMILSLFHSFMRFVYENLIPIIVI